VGNFFFAGARLFFRSLEAAIFLFARVARIPDGSDVLPAVCTEERLVLAALLADGTVLRGQNEISHPTPASSSAVTAPSPGPPAVDKGSAGRAPLAAPIVRVFYAPSDALHSGGGGGGTDSSGGSGATSTTAPGGELAPPANPRALAAVRSADAVVYGMGSLYTSVLPALILDGVGEAVAACGGPKILLLNGGVDRETGAALEGWDGGSGGSGGSGAPSSSSTSTPRRPMTAEDVADAVARALVRARPRDAAGAAAATPRALGRWVSAVLYPEGTAAPVDAAALAARGVARVSAVRSRPAPGGDGGVVYDPDALVDAIGAEVAAWAAERKRGGGA
jgi:hypothetical protein